MITLASHAKGPQFEPLLDRNEVIMFNGTQRISLLAQH